MALNLPFHIFYKKQHLPRKYHIVAVAMQNGGDLIDSSYYDQSFLLNYTLMHYTCILLLRLFCYIHTYPVMISLLFPCISTHTSYPCGH